MSPIKVLFILDKLKKKGLGLLAEGGVFLSGAVALDRLDVLVRGLGPELVGEVQVEVTILGLEFLLE